MLDQEITRRMDAYRGNPQALAQRYQQNQQLVDLLALQKLKSEKEAAARSLQMQQPDAGGLPTVAQQREQEVMDMTRQEVAQQVGQTAQQQQAKQQAAMQQLMSGLARAPGAANAMSPQAMAAGGIVAFQSGGGTSRFSDEDEEERKREEEDRVRAIIASQVGAGRQPTISNTEELAERAFTPRTGITSVAPAAAGSAMDSLSAAREKARTLTGVTDSERRAAESQREGIAALQGLIQSQQLQAADIPGMTPEDLAARRAEIASARQRMEQEFDPSRQRLDQLIAFLSGAAGRTSLGSVGAGGARAAQATAAQQEAARRERLKEVSGMEEGLRSKLETERMGKFQAMQTAGDRAVNARLKLTELSNALAEGDARRANELLNTGLRLAGEAGMTDARLKTEVGMLAQKMGLQLSEGDLDRYVKMLDIASKERTAAAQIDKTTDAREMIAAYEADFIEQGMSPVKARAAAAERFQSNYRDATNRAAATEARKIADVMKSPLVTVLLPGLMSKDPAKKEAAQKQLREVFALAGIDPDSADARAAMSQQTPGAPTRPSAGGSTPPLPPGFQRQ
jgi:hypothetical protein